MNPFKDADEARRLEALTPLKRRIEIYKKLMRGDDIGPGVARVIASYFRHGRPQKRRTFPGELTIPGMYAAAWYFEREGTARSAEERRSLKLAAVRKYRCTRPELATWLKPENRDVPFMLAHAAEIAPPTT
jgi:hypothetical protein